MVSSNTKYLILVAVSMMTCGGMFIFMEQENLTSMSIRMFKTKINSSSSLQGRPSNEKEIKSSTWSYKDNKQEAYNIIFESTQYHDFKSPYIVNPNVYRPSIPAINKTGSSNVSKNIVCYICPKGMQANYMNYKGDFKYCPSNCKLKYGKENVSSADVVIFHLKYVGKQLPPHRPKGQIWVAATWESPPHTPMPAKYDAWKGVFNWTFNYRTDSEFFAPNNLLAWRARDTLLSDQDYLKITKKKTKTAVFWVSNCSKESKRLAYAKEMQKYIDVDIYGKCGPLKCPKGKLNLGEDRCQQMLNTTYKFYLSFENSFCPDYVTEKFFRNFYRKRLNIIPVARGGFDYNKYVPKDAFINTANFKTAKELALYLKDLGNDHVRYAAMLREKDKLVALDIKHDWCDICEKVNTYTDVKIIPDIKKWYQRDRACFPPKDI